MARIGSAERPMVSANPIDIAGDFVRDVFETEGRLWWSRGRFLVWRGGRWVVRGPAEMTLELWRWLEGTYHRSGPDGTGATKYVPSRGRVADVLEALRAKTECRWAETPVWTEKAGDRPRVGSCVAFEDVVVDVESGRAIERDETWLDTMVLPFPFEREARCPRWMRCLEEWSEGDGRWVELLQWWMGYCLLPRREYAKWLLMQGVSRGGKGVIQRVIGKLMGESLMNLSAEDLAGEFGLDGVQYARVISVPDMSQVEKGGLQRLSRVTKNVVGGDAVTVNAKFERQVRNVRINAALMVAANMIPVLPNESGGVSGKMLVLPFTRSFRGSEDFDLEMELEGELQGIGVWALEGARKLVGNRGHGWPSPGAAEEVRKRFRTRNNPMDSFLEARCVRAEDGFVPTGLLWREWCDFARANELRVHVTRNGFAAKLIEDGSWDLRKARKSVAGGAKEGDEEFVRGIRGLSLRRVTDDEQ